MESFSKSKKKMITRRKISKQCAYNKDLVGIGLNSYLSSRNRDDDQTSTEEEWVIVNCKNEF